MQVTPLAADSLGVRSMATLVEIGGVRILVDPGVTLADSRFGMGPTAEEKQAQEAAVNRIVGALCQVDAVVVTHYHDDHMNLLPYVLSTTAVYLKTPATAKERRFAQDLFPRLQTAIQKIIDDLNAPTGYTAEVGGTSQQQSESYKQLFLALGASVLLAYLLMAVLYNSLLHPFVILFSLPVAVGGAFLSATYYPHIYMLAGLLECGRDLSRETPVSETVKRMSQADSSPVFRGVSA